MEQVGRHLQSLQSPQQLTDLSIGSIEAMKLAAYHAKLILGCYRVGDANDPNVYTTAVTAVLSRYPADIGARLSDPKDGIAGRFKWLPTVSEVREECDRLANADAAALRRARDLREQMQLRDELRPAAPATPRPERKILSNFTEATAKHGRPIGPFEVGREHLYDPR